MPELTERIASGRPPAGVASDWLIAGATKEVITKEAGIGDAILARLRTVLDHKFQVSCQIDYEQDASERERAFAGGYRKALKDIHRLLQLDT